MSIQDAISKTKEDVNDVMMTIQSIKGDDFAAALAIHMNFSNLLVVVKVIENECEDSKIAAHLSKLALELATSSMARITTLSKFSDDDIKELIDWGEKIDAIISGNLSSGRRND